MELPSRFSYNPKWWAILACFVFFGACSAVMAHKATNNSVGLILNGVITIGATGATVFYWVISALGAGFVALALLLESPGNSVLLVSFVERGRGSFHTGLHLTVNRGSRSRGW